MNIFEIATREKYRFPYKGNISVEDLWDLSLPQLDSVYKALNKELKAQDTDTLMRETPVDNKLSIMIEVVKRIFEAKQAEIEAKKLEAKNRAEREKILEALGRRRDEVLNSMTEEELLKKLEELK